MATCLIEGCECKSKSRGLCGNCYQAARNKVKSGVVTWEQLENIGLAKPSTHGAGPGNSTFGKAFHLKADELAQVISMGFAKPATKVPTVGARPFAVALAAKMAGRVKPIQEVIDGLEDGECVYPPAPEADTIEDATPAPEAGATPW